jgi:hypothetical protein
LGADLLVGVELLRAMPGDGARIALELTDGASTRRRRRERRPFSPARSAGRGRADRRRRPLRLVALRGGALPQLRRRGRRRRELCRAALFLADIARSVTLACRSDSLDRGISKYLVDRIAAHD